MSSAPAPLPSAAPARSPARRVLANPNFLSIFIAGMISVAGSNFSNLAIVWVVFARTGSSLDVAWVGVAGLAGSILLTLPAGVWVDRYSRRQLMILADLLRAVCSAALAIILLLVGFSLVTVVTVSFAWSASGSLFNPAEQSLLPALVRPEEIPHANGLIQSSRSIAGLLASSAAGALILVAGAIPTFWVNAGTFLVSALLVSLVVVQRAKGPVAPAKPRALGREMKEGMRWLYGQKGLFQLSLSAGPLNFFSTIPGAFLVVFVVVLLHGNALVLGILTGLTALGNAAGALLVGRTGAVQHAGQVWLLAYGLGYGAVIVAVAVHPLLDADVFLFFASGLLNGYAGATWLSTAQTLVPTELQGRYFSIDAMLSYGILPASEVAGGIMIAVWGVDTTFLVCGLAMSAVGLLFLPARSLWRWGVPRPSSRETLRSTGPGTE